MLALHCLCLLIHYSKQQQLNPIIRSKITIYIRPFLFDSILKIIQFHNQLYDRHINLFYETFKINLTYSKKKKKKEQLYLGTYESNNMAKATITSTTTPSSLPVSFVRFQSTSGGNIIDDQRLRDYLHRLFDIYKEIINELFLTFLDIFLPYIQQRLTTMWNSLLTTIINYQQGECSDEVIEECVCVLLTRDFVDIIRYFIYKTTIIGQTNLIKVEQKKKK
ncbi:unnamed protein product [Rotaria sordida]|nr:unnamed protein product [Rotaria sordida]CAF1486612.1 unnamed protein product [Rotaria sordida]CAF4027235.1 unnamed protein product [Rotaria sordida]CAF4044990.1 unnamed protein product [Rotaria sordida]